MKRPKLYLLVSVSTPVFLYISIRNWEDALSGIEKFDALIPISLSGFGLVKSVFPSRYRLRSHVFRSLVACDVPHAAPTNEKPIPVENINAGLNYPNAL